MHAVVDPCSSASHSSSGHPVQLHADDGQPSRAVGRLVAITVMLIPALAAAWLSIGRAGAEEFAPGPEASITADGAGNNRSVHSITHRRNHEAH